MLLGSSPFLLFLAAVMISSYAAGFRPGLLAALLRAAPPEFCF
jgi:hypothetical protein